MRSKGWDGGSVAEGNVEYRVESVECRDLEVGLEIGIRAEERLWG